MEQIESKIASEVNKVEGDTNSIKQNGTTEAHSNSSSNSSLAKYGPLPVSGVFAIVKPSGPTSMSILDKLKPLLRESKVFQQINEIDPNQRNRDRKRRNNRKFNKQSSDPISAPKLGQGGTLDPLADGVLVIGIGAGTKKLNDYIQCTKRYKTIGLLGSSTLSYDCKDPLLERKPFDHIIPEKVKEILKSDFTGDHLQTPPLYSAIRIEGKRLFDYARSGEPLPSPIQPRKVRIEKIDLIDWLKPGEHTFKEPEQECSEEERKLALTAQRLIDGDDNSETETNKGETTTQREEDRLAPAFSLDMTVTSGTYVRSIVHDLGSRLNSAAHVVRLTRVRQGDWVLPGYESESDEKQILREAIEWSIFENAIKESSESEENSTKRRKLADGESQDVSKDQVGDKDELKEWERLILERIQRC